VTRWIEITDRLPDENSEQLELTDGKREFDGYYQNGRFLAQTPPDAEGSVSITWAPETITGWLPKKDKTE
jgi:hypothetical protein